MIINVIYTFNSGKQLILDVEVPSQIFQFEYIDYLFSLLTPNELKSLIKISNSQYANRASAIKWLMIESKYYFDKKEDPFWHKFKSEYKKRQHSDSILNVFLYGKLAFENHKINAALFQTREAFSAHIYKLISKYQNIPRRIKHKKVPIKDKIFRVIYFTTTQHCNIEWLKNNYVDKRL